MKSRTNTFPRIFALAMLNHTLADEEIVPFLENLKKCGYEGICPHPRDGLLVPYGNRRYWESIVHIISLASQRGFAVWHYDEFTCPSGRAGGRIPADDPSLCVRTLHFEVLEKVTDGNGLINVGPEPLLALLRYRVDAHGAKRSVRDVTADCGVFLGTGPWGEWHNRYYTGALHVHEELHERAIVDYYTRVYNPVDLLEPDERLLAVKIVPAEGEAWLPGRVDPTRWEATDRFLELVYRPLAELSEQHGLGSTPVFQDEVTFGAPWPWSAPIENQLRLEWGEDFAVNLAALHAPDVEGWETSRCQFRAACRDAIEENWFARVASFCHENGLQTTGHLAGEETLLGHCQMMGNAFHMFRHFDVPGFDIISSTLPDDINRSSELGIKIVQSAAWMQDRKPTMAEAFGANGLHSDLQRQRNVLSWLALHDITKIFDHSPHVSTKGTRKYGAPPISSRFNPLDVGRSELWQWFNWFADILAEYSFDPQTLILFPIESLARYCMSEVDLWREEASFLETWFHFAFAASLDAILLPSDRLRDVEARPDGFHFDGHTFQNFVVPPFASLPESVWEGVLSLCTLPRFVWCAPDITRQVTVFGDGHSRAEKIPTERIYCTNEAELMTVKAAWFDDIFDSPLKQIHSPRSILKSRRLHTDGSEMIVVLNPHDQPIAVTVEIYGEIVAQPPHCCVLDSLPPDVKEIPTDKTIYDLAPRDVLMIKKLKCEKLSTSDNTKRSIDVTRTSRTKDSEIIHPVVSQLTLRSRNTLSLKSGTIRLQGFDEREFIPAPVSALWPLPVTYCPAVPEYALPYSRQRLESPLSMEASFPLVLEEPITDLDILLDQDSAPASVQAFWDEHYLEPHKAEVFDSADQVYSVPKALLQKGPHKLCFEATITSAAEGVLERPIILGSFLVGQHDASGPLSLKPMPATSFDWNRESATSLGMPEGFGPWDYSFVFELTLEQAQHTWLLWLPTCIGVAEISLNEQALGRLVWEPRVLKLDSLHSGANKIDITLHGSWNNVFSSLNRHEGGLTGIPVLRRA